MSRRVVKPMARRRAGVLLHPTSLPGPQSQGDLGAEAYHFVDFLVGAGFTVWQVLPLHPPDNHRSPYVADSVHALDTNLVSDALLESWKWAPGILPPMEHQRWLTIYDYFQTNASDKDKKLYQDFCLEQASWLDDYALYRVLKTQHDDAPWFAWPEPLRNRNEKELARVAETYVSDINAVKMAQFAVYRQWDALKHYANKHGVLIFGDMPVFVAHDSVEVWIQPDMFQLDKQGNPEVVAGVPPDYFSEKGQRWGNPLYNWEHMQEDDFSWWKNRLETQFYLFDLVRLDHFRGFESCWEIPSEDDDAMNGQWVEVPGEALLASLKKHFGQLPLVAEDLGEITAEVEKLRKHFRLPGMRIIQFGYDGDPGNIHLPHNYEKNMVVYTGTHDNDTVVSWYESLDKHTRGLVDTTLGGSVEQMPWPAIRAVLGSVARLAIIPMQDIMSLGEGNRMNTPGVAEGNWCWRFEWSNLPDTSVKRLQQLNNVFSRNQ